MFITSTNQAVIYQFNSSGKLLLFDLPTPINAVGHSYMAMTMTESSGGLIIVGQVTSYEDIYGVQTVAAAPSGFIFGLDGINSCVYFDSTWTYTETTYTSLAITIVSAGDSLSTVPSTLISAPVQLTNTIDYEGTTFTEGNQYEVIEGPCTEAKVIAPTIADFYHVIQPSNYNFYINYGTWSMEPAILISNRGCNFYSYNHKLSVTGSGLTPA